MGSIRSSVGSLGYWGYHIKVQDRDNDQEHRAVPRCFASLTALAYRFDVIHIVDSFTSVTSVPRASLHLATIMSTYRAD